METANVMMEIRREATGMVEIYVTCQQDTSLTLNCSGIWTGPVNGTWAMRKGDCFTFRGVETAIMNEPGINRKFRLQA